MLKKLSTTVKKEKTTQYCNDVSMRGRNEPHCAGGQRTVNHWVSSSLLEVKSALSE